MDFIAKNTAIEKTNTQCAVVFTFGNALLASAAAVDKALGGVLSNTIKLKDLGETAGSCSWFSVATDNRALKCDRVLLVQLSKNSTSNGPKAGRHSGKHSDNHSNKHSIDRKTWSTALDAAFARVCLSNAKDATLFIDDLNILDTHNETTNALLAKIAATAAIKSVYRYSETKSEVKPCLLTKVIIASDQVAGLKKGLVVGKSLGLGINTARELGNLPGNICTPTYLADLAKSYARDCELLSTKILHEKNMEKLGMGSLLSVSRGSDEEAKLIVMEYSNGKAGDAPHVLVGKGITFDTGGISLKPGASMDEMKFDMCGAASVFGAISALIAMKANVNVVAIVAAAENMPSGRATKPGDVVRSMSGQTIEVLNTDAEGRLVLCDALTYAERFKPKSVVDIATLTGACVVALGSHATGVFSNDDDFAKTLLECGERALDRAWHMPLWDEYQKQLDSNFADIANIGGREAGSVTAACFLSRFTKSYTWAHLDIAGTAWVSGSKKGATGRPVSLLVEYLLNH